MLQTIISYVDTFYSWQFELVCLYCNRLCGEFSVRIWWFLRVGPEHKKQRTTRPFLKVLPERGTEDSRRIVAAMRSFHLKPQTAWRKRLSWQTPSATSAFNAFEFSWRWCKERVEVSGLNLRSSSSHFQSVPNGLLIVMMQFSAKI